MADDEAGPGRARMSDTRIAGIKWVLQTLAMPIALVTLPLLYQWKAAENDEKNRDDSRRREQAEQQFRLYTDLMSKREESDTAVRRGLFDKLMGTYLAPTPGDVGKRLVALELLSLNFHDSLNLSPLFWELAADIGKAPASKIHRRALEFRRREPRPRVSPDSSMRPSQYSAASASEERTDLCSAEIRLKCSSPDLS